MENHGKILYEKNANSKMYPASITKILTAIVVMDNCELSDTAVVSQSSINNVQSGYITANLAVGEELTIEELLNLLLMSSYNDVANVLAEYVAGNVENFAKLMNEKAKEIGCENSNFVNSNGAHNENHYSTAYDLALISKYAMSYEAIKDIVAKTYYQLGDTNKYIGIPRIYETTNELITMGSVDNYYKYAKGIKTGYTTPAGFCLSSYAYKNGMELFVVVLKNKTSDERYVDTKKLYEYGFQDFEISEIAKKGETIQTVDVIFGTANTRKLNVVLENKITAIVNKSTNVNIEPKVEIEENLKAPIQEGTKVGIAMYEVEGITYQVNLVASHTVVKTYIHIFFIALFIVLIIILGIIKIIHWHRKEIRIQKIKNI